MNDDDKNDARHRGDDRDDEPSASEVVWSLSEDYRAQVAKWAQIPVKQVEYYDQVQRAFAAAIAASAAAVEAAYNADAAVKKARQTVPKGLLDFLGPLASMRRASRRVMTASSGLLSSCCASAKLRWVTPRRTGGRHRNSTVTPRQPSCKTRGFPWPGCREQRSSPT